MPLDQRISFSDYVRIFGSFRPEDMDLEVIEDKCHAATNKELQVVRVLSESVQRFLWALLVTYVFLPGRLKVDCNVVAFGHPFGRNETWIRKNTRFLQGLMRKP